MGTIKEFHLFVGIGGGVHGGHILGYSCCGAVEIDDYCKDALEQGQQDDWMDSFPMYGDITSLNGRNFKGTFDILCGDFPCQAFSYVTRGRDISEKNLLPEMLRFVWESEVPTIFAKNVTLNAIHTASMGPESTGYRVRYCKLSCGELGADYRHDRYWLLTVKTPNALSKVNESLERLDKIHMGCRVIPFSELKNEVVANRRAQLKVTGNALVPLAVAAVFRVLVYRHKNQICNSVKVLGEEINRFSTVQPTWIKDTHKENFRFVHTPTTMANYSAPSMMKHTRRRNSVGVFNRPTPANAGYLMGLSQGASTADSMNKENMKIWLQKLRLATIRKDLSSEEQFGK